MVHKFVHNCRARTDLANMPAGRPLGRPKNGGLKWPHGAGGVEQEAGVLSCKLFLVMPLLVLLLLRLSSEIRIIALPLGFIVISRATLERDSPAAMLARASSFISLLCCLRGMGVGDGSGLTGLLIIFNMFWNKI